MRQWNTTDGISVLDRAIQALREGKLLEPKTFGQSDPLNLQGMSFPTVGLCKELDLPTVVVNRVVGKQEFSEAILRQIDFSSAQLDFSVWNDCHFEKVSFDNASLQQVRFFGCRFDSCSFRSTDLRDASFSVARTGRESEITHTNFENADFRGASCHNPVLRSTSFVNCKLDGFVFDGATCEAVSFTGRYHELSFRGMPGETARNRLQVDLSRAKIVWLNADFGVDLSETILPADGSCIVIADRLRAVDILCKRLPFEAGEDGVRVAQSLKALFSDTGMSPLEMSQKTLLISLEMIADFAGKDSNAATMLFATIHSIAESEGVLA